MQTIKKLLKKYRLWLLVFTAAGILIDSFIFKTTHNVVILFFSGLWILSASQYRLEGRFSILIALIFLMLCPFLLIFNKEDAAEKVANWAYMFLVIGVLQNWYELKFHPTNLKTIEDVLPAVTPYVQILVQFFKFLIIAVLRNVKKAVVIFLLFLAAVYAVSYIRAIIHKEQVRQYRLSLNPVITAAEPGIVYHSTKIVLYGKSFDLRSDRSAVVRFLGASGQKEEVPIDYIDNTKIIFTAVPLHWHTGQLYFWVETPIVWEGKRIIAKSNVVGVRLIPRVTPYSPGFSPDDEAYFNQLKTLHKETLQINEYE